MTHQLSAETKHHLIEQASQAREKAYAPYSHYQVGAALLTADGQIFTGCNVENATYPAAICAERTAVVKGVSEGVRQFIAVAVVTQNGGSPCGICRQVLNEFSDDMVVLIADHTGNLVLEIPLSDLLPHAFSATSLNTET